MRSFTGRLGMAEVSERYEANAPGAYFTDKQCIDCDLCRQTAPANFTRHEDGGYSYVYRQPQTPEEVEACKQALAFCPVDAIGADGTAAPDGR